MPLAGDEPRRDYLSASYCEGGNRRDYLSTAPLEGLPTKHPSEGLEMAFRAFCSEFATTELEKIATLHGWVGGSPFRTWEHCRVDSQYRNDISDHGVFEPG